MVGLFSQFNRHRSTQVTPSDQLDWCVRVPSQVDMWETLASEAKTLSSEYNERKKALG